MLCSACASVSVCVCVLTEPHHSSAASATAAPQTNCRTTTSRIMAGRGLDVEELVVLAVDRDLPRDPYSRVCGILPRRRELDCVAVADLQILLHLQALVDQAAGTAGLELEWRDLPVRTLHVEIPPAVRIQVLDLRQRARSLLDLLRVEFGVGGMMRDGGLANGQQGERGGCDEQPLDHVPSSFDRTGRP